MHTDFFNVVHGMPWYAWVAIAGILCGCITSWVRMNHSHAERMAMIQQGMNPDARDGKPTTPPEL